MEHGWNTEKHFDTNCANFHELSDKGTNLKPKAPCLKASGFSVFHPCLIRG
jgi:hypothetical protein